MPSLTNLIDKAAQYSFFILLNLRLFEGNKRAFFLHMYIWHTPIIQVDRCKFDSEFLICIDVPYDSVRIFSLFFNDKTPPMRQTFVLFNKALYFKIFPLLFCGPFHRVASLCITPKLSGGATDFDGSHRGHSPSAEVIGYTPISISVVLRSNCLYPVCLSPCRRLHLWPFPQNQSRKD